MRKDVRRTFGYGDSLKDPFALAIALSAGVALPWVMHDCWKWLLEPEGLRSYASALGGTLLVGALSVGALVMFEDATGSAALSPLTVVAVWIAAILLGRIAYAVSRRRQVPRTSPDGQGFVTSIHGAVIEPAREVPTHDDLEYALESYPLLADVAARIKTAARPQTHLVTTTEGQPAGYLIDPAGQRSPVMLAVIELASICQGVGLPEMGSLAFFHNSGSHTWGDKPADAQQFSVSYSDAPAAHFVGEFTKQAVPVVAVHGVGLPALGSIDEASIGLDSGGQEDAYLDLLDELYGEPGSRSGVPGTWVGGHAYQFQDDMQEQCAEMAREAWGIDSVPSEWRLLLQLASDPNAGMSWGDEGFLVYWIRETDLAQRRFEYAWCVLETT